VRRRALIQWRQDMLRPVLQPEPGQQGAIRRAGRSHAVSIRFAVKGVEAAKGAVPHTPSIMSEYLHRSGADGKEKKRTYVIFPRTPQNVAEIGHGVVEKILPRRTPEFVLQRSNSAPKNACKSGD
jgi:hypothetical protein